MKVTHFCAIFATIWMVGCSSKVVSYDGAGNMLGSCTATRGLLTKAGADCQGQSLGHGYEKINPVTGYLPVLPENTQIHLSR